MSLTTSGILCLLLTVVTGMKAGVWKLPSATDVQASFETCQITNLNLKFLNRDENRSGIRCFTKALGLWRDGEGFKANRFVKLLNKRHQSTEVSIVVTYCNDSRKQPDLDKWANEAFNCFAHGRMGSWIREYIKSVYKKKLTN